MAQPSPLSSLSTGGEVTGVTVACPGAEIRCECKRLGQEQVVGGRDVRGVVAIDGGLLARRAVGPTASNEGRRNDRRKRVA